MNLLFVSSDSYLKDMNKHYTGVFVCHQFIILFGFNKFYIQKFARLYKDK